MKKVKFYCVIAAMMMTSWATTANAAFVIGGENGWQLSTDGIVDVFATYYTASPMPGGNRFMSFLNMDSSYSQKFGVQVGLLPSVVAFNVKAPTVNGIESTVRIGIYPNIQNTSQYRFETSPNIDFREIYYNAKGKYGELLAGRALNLFQSKNILTDMTLLTAGVVPFLRGGTTLGHIGYGYLYTNFGPQIRYTTPDMNGVKVALSVNEPYRISSGTSKTPSPRVESQISYATVTTSGTTFQAWFDSFLQVAPRVYAPATPTHNQAYGFAAGVETGFKGIDLLASGYVGQGLGVISVQDGDEFGSSSTDGAGQERTHWGFLVQATYQLNPDWKIGVNYGHTHQAESQYDKKMVSAGEGSPYIPMEKQEAVVGMVTYNLTKFIQFVGEYTYAWNTWHDTRTQHSNTFALGTMYYW